MIEIGADRHFAIQRAPRRASVWSTRMLAFEPKGWQLDLRAAMELELDRLSQLDEPLAIEVWDREHRVHDLENAVMYNIGPSRYEPFMAPGLHLRRVGSPLLDDLHTPLAEPIAAQYRFTVGAAKTSAREARLSGRVTFSFKVSRMESVLAIWRAATGRVGEDALTHPDGR